MLGLCCCVLLPGHPTRLLGQASSCWFSTTLLWWSLFPGLSPPPGLTCGFPSPFMAPPVWCYCIWFSCLLFLLLGPWCLESPEHPWDHSTPPGLGAERVPRRVNGWQEFERARLLSCRGGGCSGLTLSRDSNQHLSSHLFSWSVPSPLRRALVFFLSQIMGEAENEEVYE